VYLPKPKRLGSEWSYFLHDSIGYWESFHKVNGRLSQCTSNCPYCGLYPKFTRCRINATLIGTDVTGVLSIATKKVVDKLKDTIKRKGALKGVIIILKGTGTAFELESIREPPSVKQLNLF